MEAFRGYILRKSKRKQWILEIHFNINMKGISFGIIFLFLIKLVFSQEMPIRSTTIDTVYCSKDSTVVFVQNYIDSTLMKSYYGMFTDSIDRKFRYGFLRLKKGVYREYRIGVKWDEKEFEWWLKYPGYRGPEGELVIWRRIE